MCLACRNWLSYDANIRSRFLLLTRSLSVKSKRSLHRSQIRAKLRVQQLERRDLLAGDICHNFVEAGDVNLDGKVSAVDAVVLINRLSSQSSTSNATDVLGSTELLLDVDDNGSLSVNDALQVINRLAWGEASNEKLSEGLTRLATAILTEDLPSGMRAQTAQAWFTKLHQKLETPAFRRGAFDHLDQNADGELTEDEVHDAHWTRISAADTDETGAISRDEAKAARPSERMLALLPAKVRPHFDSLDENQDGQLSENEVTSKLWSRIIKADINEDNVVSLDELKELREQWKSENGRPDRGDIFERFDENEDGLLTEDEVDDKLWNKIAKADANQDGLVSVDELKELREQWKSENERPGRGDIFERFDENEDGLLTEDEVDDKLWNKIAKADANDDGVVSVDELKEMHEPQVIVCLAPVLDRVFSQLDEDGDGLLTDAEVGGGVWALISKADANQDGAISMMELDAKSDAWGLSEPNAIFERVVNLSNANQDGVLTEGEVEEWLWNCIFDADQNDDNAITLDEIFASLKDGDRLSLQELAEKFALEKATLTGVVTGSISRESLQKKLHVDMTDLGLDPSRIMRASKRIALLPFLGRGFRKV